MRGPFADLACSSSTGAAIGAVSTVVDQIGPTLTSSCGGFPQAFLHFDQAQLAFFQIRRAVSRCCGPLAIAVDVTLITTNGG